MMAMLPPLDKAPVLDPSQDFYGLRREGIGFIQAAGSDQWTDYNVHDPGITILEALCFAITDLGYRMDWPIGDILAPASPSADPKQPYPHQPFFTARDILTVNPTTANDLRRILVDLDRVKNAWVICKACACDVSYWAFCDLSGQLVLQYGKPANPPNPAKETFVHGLYEAMLELEDDPALGDLNDRMVPLNSVYHDAAGAHTVAMELRFPDISLLARDQWQLLLSDDAVFNDPTAYTIALTSFGATKAFNVLGQSKAQQDSYIKAQWNNVFYASLKVTLTAAAKTINIDNAALRVFGDSAVRNAATVDSWTKLFTDTSAGGFIARYRGKAKATQAAVASAKQALRQSRNLDEDYCLITEVGVEDVAVCADIELKANADIEQVQAEIWFAIEQYLNPPIPFRTLQQLQIAGVPVETIFNGPALANGFVADADLDAAGLKSMLYGSDIINRLMSIDGVIAVNQLRMTKYDSEGVAVAGAADPTWSSGKPVYDPTRISAAWLLAISTRHQPRLYLNLSRFLFLKNGLPFSPRLDGAADTLNQLRGEAERPKNPNAPNDLPIPRGHYRSPPPDDYTPLQYGFPLVYGIGPDGLPKTAPPERRAHARNLKAYLMVFEQLLGNALEQLAHTADLFSLDPAIANSYFVKAFDPTTIDGFNDIATSNLKASNVQALVETPSQFLTRRNVFLDHLLARFGESFADYALLLTNVAGNAVAQPRLIANKIAFLRRYPVISRDRAKAFDTVASPNAPGNQPPIKRRISLLLGDQDLDFTGSVGAPNAGHYPVAYQLVDGNQTIWLQGTVTIAGNGPDDAKQAAWHLLLQRMELTDAYAVAGGPGGVFTLSLTDAGAVVIGLAPQTFATSGDAAAVRDALVPWAAAERMIVVEHILLRPKFIGDALYPACCDEGCATCGCEDPYSFRLTYVMPGWTAQYTDNLDLRGYAESTIQQETPAHLLPKICWVGNDGFVENPCDDIVDQLAALLMAQGKTAADVPPTQVDACTCANAIYHAFSQSFSGWFASMKFTFLHKAALMPLIDAQLKTVAQLPAGTCTTVFTAPLWDQIRAAMTAYFVDIALYGWQFERFEWAWRQWLDANAAVDWTEERLVDRVEAILAAKLQTATTPPGQLCTCAQDIVTSFGTHFFSWMQGNVMAGNSVDKLTAFPVPNVTLCPGLTFSADAQPSISTQLQESYAAYVKPSYWLWAVVTLLGGLRNTYPGATLHDCDEISDRNPVRLGSTALGNYPRRTTL